MFISFHEKCILRVNFIDALLLIAGWIKSLISYVVDRQQQSGTVEACWAHNPEVRGSKPSSASIVLRIKMFKARVMISWLQGFPCEGMVSENEKIRF